MMDSKIRNNRPELLSPAGDPARLEAAVRFGADAVYLAGKSFGMRTAPSNFTAEQMESSIQFAREQGVKVYVTCNIVPHEEEMAQLPKFLEQTARAGVDAYIVSDVGVLRVLRRELPDAEIHISTQAGIVNAEAANFFYEQGARRIVPARELSLEELGHLRKNIPDDMEIEAFVHGAMCVSFSGRCLLSSYMTGRDSNRGDCAQPCRWRYNLVEEKRPGQYFPIEENEKGTYILNSKDMCMISHLPELLKAGVTSFKIEGRAKSAYYVALMTNAYRQALDAAMEGRLPEPWVLEEVNKISHREYSTGFFFGEEPGQNLNSGGYVRDYEVVAAVTDWRGDVLFASQRNRFFEGDTLEVLQPGKAPFELKVSNLCNETGEEISSAPHATMMLSMQCKNPVAAGALLRKRRE